LDIVLVGCPTAVRHRRCVHGVVGITKYTTYSRPDCSTNDTTNSTSSSTGTHSSANSSTDYPTYITLQRNIVNNYAIHKISTD
jgi:hypothetical protein